MKLIEWIPTVGEVLDWMGCTLTDHSWVKGKDGIVRCQDCGKQQ